MVCCRRMQGIKYGVVGMDTLLRDLTSWESLLLAGRLHKPVLHVVRDDAVIKAVDANLQAALATSLLLLPETFTTQVWPTDLWSSTPNKCAVALLDGMKRAGSAGAPGEHLRHILHGGHPHGPG